MTPRTAAAAAIGAAAGAVTGWFLFDVLSAHSAADALLWIGVPTLLYALLGAWVSVPSREDAPVETAAPLGATVLPGHPLTVPARPAATVASVPRPRVTAASF